jgi:NAD dependent epimerase/dehydratase family enzyme
MLGEGASVVTEGQRVLPQRIAQERGYAFAFPTLDAALADVL